MTVSREFALKIVIRENANEVSISVRSFHQILSDKYELRRLRAKFLLLFSPDYHKKTRVENTHEHAPASENENFLRR